MRFVTVKDLSDSFTLVRGKGCDIDQRFYAILIRSGNHCTGIGVPSYDDGTSCPGDCPVQCSDVVAERGEWKRRGNELQVLFTEKKNDVLPTRSIRPST